VTPSQLRSNIIRQDRITREEIEDRAEFLAEKWKSNVHVYIDSDGILYSQGADEIHPRRTPKFIKEYIDVHKTRQHRRF